MHIDERQIAHLICARLKYDLYDLFRGCFWAFYTRKRKEAGPKHPLKKSYRSYFRRAQIRWVIGRSFSIINIYIYICAVESKSVQDLPFFWVRDLSNFSSFFPFCFFQNYSSFCRENELIKKKKENKTNIAIHPKWLHTHTQKLISELICQLHRTLPVITQKIPCVIMCLVSGPSRVSGLRAFLACNLWLSCASPPLSWSLTVSAVVTSQWSWNAS